MLNKNYGSKWITVAGTAAFQHYFLRIISWFIFTFRLSEVQGDKAKQVIPYFPQYSAHPLMALVPTTVTAASDFFRKA